MPYQDPRLQTGAYITDGRELYEVIGLQQGPGVMGMRTVRVIVQNCRNFRGLEFLPEKVRAAFNLVRHPPRAWCPDRVEEICWSRPVGPARPAGPARRQDSAGCGGSWGVGKSPSISSIR